VYSFDKEQALYSGFDRVLRSELGMRVQGGVEFYTEYLDMVRFPSSFHADDLVKLLRLKYASQKPDLIIPVSYGALHFLLLRRKELFPGTPIVALFNERRIEEIKQYIANSPAPNITGVTSTDDPAGTVGLAFALQPDTQHVAVVVGSSQLEKSWLDELQQDLAPYARRVDIIYLADLPMNQLLDRISTLPAHSVILNTFFFQDAVGQFFLPEEVLELMVRNAHVPIYSIYSTYLGQGVIGGRMTNPDISARRVADLATAVLNGERAAAIPIIPDDALQDTVDWRQLQRWRIPSSRVPRSTLILFREPSEWEKYRTLILIVIAVGAIQTFLIVMLMLNIRRRKVAEKALLREKALADAVIEGLPGVFVLQDESGKNVRWNRTLDRIIRFRPDQVDTLGNIAEHDRQSVQLVREDILQRGSAHAEVEVLTGGGKTVPFYISGVKVELEGKPHIAAIGIDLTERKKVEDALRRSEAAIRSLVENAPYGIATISVREGRFVQANPAMVKLLGYESEAEVTALSFSRDLYPEGDVYCGRTQITSADFFDGVEFTWKRRDGKLVHVHASGRRIRQREDTGDLIEIIAEDVTVRRSLEEQLRHTQKMEALGQLSGGVAHDFNNLLSVIIGYSELLSLDPALEASGKTNLATIKNAAERAASLTAQLLAFSRRQVAQPSVINLNSLVRETEKMLQRLIRENVTLQITLDPELWKLRADAGQIMQVILNLAINARDAMPKGGILSLKTANVTFPDFVTFGATGVAPGQYVMLSVTDTGIGMDRQTLSRIFEPFFTTKSNGEGTGLGLATVYGIIQQTAGYIVADSQPGKGATFTIYLPRVEKVMESTSASLSSAVGRKESASGTATLLIVEDEAAFRNLLRDGLQSKGYEVLVAANGLDALRVAEAFEGEIRMLVTDVIMPNMSGPELVSALRKTRPNVAVLYMSGYAADEMSDDPLSSQAALMQKPFYIDQIARKIRDLIAVDKTAASRLQI
jgi:PAS domain S-box-containing protein